METISNLHLLNLIFEEIDIFLEQNPLAVSTILRRNIDKQLRRFLFLERVLKELESEQNLSQDIKTKFRNMEKVIYDSDTFAFFVEVLSTPVKYIKSIKQLFDVVDRSLSYDEAVQSSVEKAKMAISIMDDIAHDRMKQTKEKEKQADTAANTMKFDGNKTAATQTARIKEEVTNSQADRNLKLAKQEIERLKQFLSNNINQLINSGKDEDSKNIVQKQSNALNNALDSFDASLEQHVGTKTVPLPDPAEPESMLEEDVLNEQQYTQEQAVYSQVSNRVNQECQSCKHFIKNGTCKLVEGRINSQGWCKFWKSSDPRDEGLSERLEKSLKRWKNEIKRRKKEGRKEALEVAEKKVKRLTHKLILLKKKS